MATLSFQLSAAGYSGKGSASVSYNAVYNKETNQTVVTFYFVSLRRGTILGTPRNAAATIGVVATDNEESRAVSTILSNSPSPLGFDGVPSPQSVIIEHGNDNPEKSIIITFSASLAIESTAGSTFFASGNGSETVEVGLASLFYVGDRVGSLYIAKNGNWHTGVLHVSKDGYFLAGVGYIPITLTVTYDGEGNVYLDGVGVTHDNAGNVVMSGVTATDDGDGNITIT